MAQYLNDSIFWIEIEKIQPNPYQPRRDFDENALRDLADSIRQYGVLQPLVVTRKEEAKEDGGLRVSYELIAGERRLRASKIAGLQHVPAVIRAEDEDPRAKLEIAIIENLQREDLNAVDRAVAFSRLAQEFGFKHGQIARKVGRSREYVSNTIRLLDLPEDAKNALRVKKISEGHARTIMMLSDKPDEQKVLFKEILYKKLSVREAEKIAREVAHERVRKKKYKPDPEIRALEGKFSDALGTRVHIERKENGGKVVIDFFSSNDLQDILQLMESNEKRGATAFLDRFIHSQESKETKEEEKIPGGDEKNRSEETRGTTSNKSVSTYESANENDRKTKTSSLGEASFGEDLSAPVQEQREVENAFEQNISSGIDEEAVAPIASFGTGGGHMHNGTPSEPDEIHKGEASEVQKKEGEYPQKPDHSNQSEYFQSQEPSDAVLPSRGSGENTHTEGVSFGWQQTASPHPQEDTAYNEQEGGRGLTGDESSLQNGTQDDPEKGSEEQKYAEKDEAEIYSVKNFTI